MNVEQHPLGPRALELLTLGAGAWVWDVQADRLYGDARFATLCGLDVAAAAEGLPTDAFFVGVLPDDRLRVRIAVTGVMRGVDLFARDYRVRDADGEVRWVSGRGRAERSPDGQLQRFSGVLADITDQKRVEEQLRIAQTAGEVGTFEYVDGFATVSVSAQFCKLLGLHAADALPVHTINALVAPGDATIIRSQEEDRDAESGYSELRIRKADTSEERWLARRGEHRSDGIGRGPRFVGVIYDITSAKRAEAQLRELARTLEQRVEERTAERDRIWTRARDLIVVTSLDGVYQSVNPAWGALLGYDEGELIGTHRGDLVHPDDLVAIGPDVAGLDTGHPIESLDLRMRAKDGSYRWVNWNALVEGDAIYAIGRDITERKQLEEQLRQSQKMEAVGQLTGGLAHDFNNMLTGVIGGLALARRRLEAGRQADVFRYMDAAMEAAERAAALTHRLLAFSRRQTLDPQAVDIGGLIDSMNELLRRTLGEIVELEVVTPEDLWCARADANQLESAILNLAINARDAMPNGGRLTIEGQNLHLDHPHANGPDSIEPGEYVVISVSDTGLGMPEEIRSKVFDPFFTTKPIGKGTGLGLSMVYGFVRQSGGHVALYSEPSVGTTIRIYLPRLPNDAAPANSPPKRSQATPGGGEQVLVVEDDPQVRLLITSLLEELGYAPLEAPDAPTGLELLEASPQVALLVTDVGLPGMNGRQMADVARKSRPDLPVLFLTGYAPAAAVRAEFLDPGMRMLSKPFALEDLASTLQEMLSEDQS